MTTIAAMPTPRFAQRAIGMTPPARAMHEAFDTRGSQPVAPEANAAAPETLDAGAPVRVIVADDHPLVLHALDSLLANYPNLQIVARAQSVPALFEAASLHAFDLVLMDLHMAGPGQFDAHEAIRAFRNEFAHKPVVVLTMETDAGALRKAIALDVEGVLSKRDRIDLIPVAIVSAMAREHYVGPIVRDLLAEAARNERREEVHRLLTRREFEVLTYYARGLGVTEIAGRLGRSVKTISAQKCSAMKKLALTNDIELYRFAVECGVTQSEVA